VGIVDQEVKQVKAEDFTREGAEERRREKQVPRRVAKGATLARDDDASSRRQIVDQEVKQVKAEDFATGTQRKCVFKGRCRASRQAALGRTRRGEHPALQRGCGGEPTEGL
jgi:hypothetical protein